MELGLGLVGLVGSDTCFRNDTDGRQPHLFTHIVRFEVRFWIKIRIRIRITVRVGIWDYG